MLVLVARILISPLRLYKTGWMFTNVSTTNGVAIEFNTIAILYKNDIESLKIVFTLLALKVYEHMSLYNHVKAIIEDPNQSLPNNAREVEKQYFTVISSIIALMVIGAERKYNQSKERS
jgi:hypothetical protein